MKGFMLAGTNSNVGKTTVTMGVMAALGQAGYTVVPYKTGPDYIDPMFHTFVTGVPSTNLDTWMVAPPMIKTLFAEAFDAQQAEKKIAVAEGVMGLFDGSSRDGEIGSPAYLAKTLGMPVVLIIDGRGMSTSAAALVKGYAEFDKNLNVAGVIINRLRSEKTFKLLKKAIEAHADVPVLGWMPQDDRLVLKSRHLGLIPADELTALKDQAALAGKLAAEHIDLTRLAGLADMPEPAGAPDPYEEKRSAYKGLTIGYAWDNAFNFYYQANFDVLKKLGVTLVPFSPLHDAKLPDGIDGMYIGGGFPEVFGKEFEANKSFREDIREKLENGLPCFAECGGLMVLTEALQDKSGETFDGIGFFPAKTVMTKRLQRFGYVDVQADLFGESFHFRAHEFHHSLVEEKTPIPKLYTVTKNGKTWQCGYTKKNTLAGYPHVHFYSDGADAFLLTLLKHVKRVKAAIKK